MQIAHAVFVLDAADIDTVAAFWGAVLGGTVEPDDGWRMIYVDGEPRLGVQHAPDHVRPQWPGGPQHQQAHIDLYVDDVAAAHDEVLALGATLLQAADLTAAEGFQVYADPAGHPFCLCWY